MNKKEKLLWLKSLYEEELSEIREKENSLLGSCSEDFANYLDTKKDWYRDQLRKIEKELRKMD